MKTKVKDNYFELIRGICIICVVLIHCQNGILYEEDALYSWNYDYWLIFRQFYNFPVAIFVFLTAYFTDITKVIEKPRGYLTKRGKRLIIPFLVWSLFYSAITVVKQGFHIDIIKIGLSIIEGKASTPLYYIVVLIQLVLITPWLIKCLKNKYLNIIAFLITPVWLVIMYSFTYITNQQIPHYESVFPTWFVFYYLGLYIKIKVPVIRKKQKSIAQASIIVVAALLFSIIECYLMLYLDLPVGFASSQIKVSSFVYSLSILNLIFVIKENHIKAKDGIVTKLGNYSYGIFYVHCFWLLILSKAMSYIPVIYNILPIYQLIELSAALALSTLSIIVTNKIMGKKLSSKLLGF